MNSSEGQSVAALRAGDRQVHEAFVDRCYVPLFQWLHWLSGDFDAAAEMTQQAFAACWESLVRADGSIDAQVWLFGIGRNVWRNAIRRNARDRRIRDKISQFAESQIVNNQGQPAATIDAESVAEIREAVAALAIDIREPLTLRYWGGLSYAQIAHALSITPTLARQRVFQGRNQLRRRLEPRLRRSS